jgi:hypothetical protein
VINLLAELDELATSTLRRSSDGMHWQVRQVSLPTPSAIARCQEVLSLLDQGRGVSWEVRPPRSSVRISTRYGWPRRVEPSAAGTRSGLAYAAGAAGVRLKLPQRPT